MHRKSNRRGLLLLAACCVVVAPWRFASAAEFRTFDGSGNNLSNSTQGAADTRVIRFGYDADYPDGIGDVITAGNKPNPRDVSNRVHAQSTSILNDRGLSDWAVHWGQFVTHDISLIETDSVYNALSTGATGDFRIPISDPNDPLGPNPLAFNRSKFDPTSGNGDLEQTTHSGLQPIPRWQSNSNSSYIDASQVYGSSQATADSLRTFVNGKLATSAGNLPMLDAANRFVAGDARANENVGLTSIHTLFVREHNRLADHIRAQDATLGDEAIYQWARRIVGAEMQAITYREFLPAIMGVNAPIADAYAYDPTLDASITTAFSTAAFRFGHSMQSPRLALVDNSNGNAGSISLGAATENPALLVSDPAKVELILKGLASQTAQENDAYVVNALRNIRFGPPGTGGTDLAALDIQRGRDHGLLNSYNRLRIAYNLAPLNDFADLTSDVALQTKLVDVYETVDNVDAWVAMISEDHYPDSSMGILGLTLLHSQFTRLRDGDRFFYSGDADLEGELAAAVIDLDSVTLSQIIRWNTEITRLQGNVFLVVPEPASWWFVLCPALALTMQRSRRRAVNSL